MKIKDPYDILGVNKKSTDNEIKTAYKKLALKHHPDRGGDVKKMQDITWARDLLFNEENLNFYIKFGVESNDENGKPVLKEMEVTRKDFLENHEEMLKHVNGDIEK